MGTVVPTEGLPATKAEALALGLPAFMPLTPCRNGHLAPRLAYRNRSKCIECRRAGARRGSRKYRSDPVNLAADRERARIYQAQRRAEGTDWASKNREAHGEMKREWKRNNLGRVRADAMRRKAAKLKAEPKWLGDEQRAEMASLYKVAVQMSGASRKDRFEVDHIVPLQGKTVCGLHVPWNLRVIPADVNNRRPRNWTPQQEAA